MTERVIWKVTGKDRYHFLQGLVSNDLLRLEKAAPGQWHALWAALLTPQGKYLADFLILRPDDGDHLLIDIAAPLASATLRRLTMYRLRAEVQFAETDLGVERGLGPCPTDAVADPRHPALGWRRYAENAKLSAGADGVDWDEIRVTHGIPESGIELLPDETFILEAGFERLHGVDFRKGCYVGQEVTARMKHKTELRKGLVPVQIVDPIQTPLAAGTPLLTAEGKEAGTLFTTSGQRGLAHLRFDRGGEIFADGVKLISLPPF